MALDPVSSIKTALRNEHLIPDVLPDSFEPTVLFSVIYPSGAEVMMGNGITAGETAEEPSINITPLSMSFGWDASNEDGAQLQETMYTLVMFDPDAPTRAEPTYRSFRHWVITGLKPTTEAYDSGIILRTKPAATPYRPPGPRPNSGVHRYTFLLFLEPLASSGYQIPDGAPEYGTALEERRSWNAVEFGERCGLKLVGVNFFRVISPTAEAS